METVDKDEESDVEIEDEAIVNAESGDLAEGEAVVAEVVEEETEKSGDVVEAEAVVAEIIEEEKINQYLLIVLLFGSINKLLFLD